MQGEWYTADPFGTPGFQAFDSDKALAEHPEYITFNGHVDALTEFHPLQAEVGETVADLLRRGGTEHRFQLPRHRRDIRQGLQRFAQHVHRQRRDLVRATRLGIDV